MQTGSDTVKELLSWGRETLRDQAAGGLEAELLLAHALQTSRAWLFANNSDTPFHEHCESYRTLVQRRQTGEPLSYLTGIREFWSMPFRVTPDVLIPRPETELLVETALELIPEKQAYRIAELGTGSGAVAIAIASERPACDIHASDISQAALEVARKNEQTLTPGRVTFHQGSWLEPLSGKFRLIVSNPPYVAEDDPHLNRGDCRFEPRIALTPGDDGLEAIQHIASGSVPCLASNGCLAFEHGYDQGDECRQILERYGYVDIETRKDLEGRDRVTLGFMKS